RRQPLCGGSSRARSAGFRASVLAAVQSCCGWRHAGNLAASVLGVAPMFTGIVTDIGEVLEIRPGGQAGDRRFVIRTRHDTAPIPIGASIACSGCCLTALEKGEGWFAVEASGETLQKTHLGDWKTGTRLNLELSLKLGDELGGHLVYGHVDGVGRVA